MTGLNLDFFGPGEYPYMNVMAEQPTETIGYTLKEEPFYFDLEDYNLIKDYCWHIDKNGYVVCKRDKTIFMHRLVMAAPSDMVVDHIYHNKNDRDIRKR